MPAPKGNKFALGNSGKHKMFATPKDLQKAVDKYFNEETVYTIEGLGLSLGCSRETLQNYEKEKGYEEFFDIIKKSKQKVRNSWLKGGLDNTLNANIVKFVMINNSDYRDKQEVKKESQEEIIIKWGGDK